jgi:hypothetical protein
MAKALLPAALALALVLAGGALQGASGAEGPPVCPLPEHPVSPPAHGLKMGLATPIVEYDDPLVRCSEAAKVVQTGARFVRQELSWRDVQPTRASAYRWTAFDAMMEATAPQGLVVLLLIDGAPRWAGAASPSAIPSDRLAFARFLSAVVRRYGPGGAFWRAHPELPDRASTHFELYNEPYQPPGKPDPAAYARLVRTAVGAARRANPRARFLIAADTTMTPDFSDFDRPWLAALYDAVPGFGRYFDGVAVHPYSIRSPLDTAAPEDSRFLTRRVEDIEATLVAHGDARRRLWITEVGWSTCPERPACVDEATQARYLAQLDRLIRTRWRFVEMLSVYAFRSYDDPPLSPLSNFGLLRPDGTRKPAWRVYRDAALRALRSSS